MTLLLLLGFITGKFYVKRGVWYVLWSTYTQRDVVVDRDTREVMRENKKSSPRIEWIYPLNNEGYTDVTGEVTVRLQSGRVGHSSVIPQKPRAYRDFPHVEGTSLTIQDNSK